MLNDHVKKFLTTGEKDDAQAIIEYCRQQNLFSLGTYLGKYLTRLFPREWHILNETALCAYYEGNYEFAYDLFNNIGVFHGLSEGDMYALAFNSHFCINHIADRFVYYNPTLVNKIYNRKKSLHSMITLTITSCKRFDLFEKTINSFLNCCTDLDRIDRWLCIDDNSSEQDRDQMKRLYPFFEFYFKTPSEKGHPQSMNIIKRMVTTPYIFHMEDDWKFFARRSYISDCLEVLHTDSKIGQCLINKNYSETSEDIDILGGHMKSTISGLKFLEHEYTPTEQSKQDFVKKYGACKSCGYWPHFSFRPSLHRMSVWNEIGDFDEGASHFEMVYAHKYVGAGYKSAFFPNIYCLHTGRLTSQRDDVTKPNAYQLNQEIQFGKKVQSPEPKKPIRFKVNVINLTRRSDRWEKFQKNDIGFKCTRYEAVDGERLKSTPQLLRIFDGNDYNMRTGMVGCAMSHFKMYVELIHSDYEFLCILEDDIEVVPDFRKKIIHVLKTAPDNWDLIYLGHHYRPELKKPEYYDKTKLPVVEKWSRMKSLTESLGGTGGYFITKSGAKKLLDFIDRVGMTNCIDTMQQRAADEMVVCYCTPHLFYSECWTGDNKPDTDIQFNYNSLTVDIDTRIKDELTFYQNTPVQTVVDFDQMKTFIQMPTEDRVLIYRDENAQNIAELIKICKYPYYTLNNEVLIVNPTDDHLNDRYFHRFKKNGEYNIDDAL